MIRRVLSGVVGIILALAGLFLFSFVFNAEPSYGLQSTDMAIAYVLLGIAIGASGIWLIRFSVRSKN